MPVTHLLPLIYIAYPQHPLRRSGYTPETELNTTTPKHSPPKTIEMDDILKTTDIIQLHKQLDEFALHHQQKGLEKAFNEVVRMRDEFDNKPQDGSKDGQIRSNAYRKALTDIIQKIRPF